MCRPYLKNNLLDFPSLFCVTLSYMHCRAVRATAPELAGDPKFRYITNQLVDNTHLAGDPKRKGCRSLLGWGIINLNMEIMEIINNKVG